MPHGPAPRRPAILAALLALAGCATPAGLSSAGSSATASSEDFEVPVTDAAGAQPRLQARLCHPDRPSPAGAPARLVVVAHGSPPNPDARPRMTLGRCGDEAARWFTSRGYAVAFALRRGYGATGGAWAEGYGHCAEADYRPAGLETARDIAATVDAAGALPGIRPDGAVVVGQSAGGWGAIALASQPHPKVAAFVVMAGGRGGHQDMVPNRNCHPERLAEAAGQYGRTARTPMLWVYAANDTFFAPEVAVAMHRAFTGAGGQAELAQPGPYGRDGHGLFFGAGGSAVWGPLVERYLAAQGAGPG